MKSATFRQARRSRVRFARKPGDHAGLKSSAGAKGTRECTLRRDAKAWPRALPGRAGRFGLSASPVQPGELRTCDVRPKVPRQRAGFRDRVSVPVRDPCTAHLFGNGHGLTAQFQLARVEAWASRPKRSLNFSAAT